MFCISATGHARPSGAPRRDNPSRQDGVLVWQGATPPDEIAEHPAEIVDNMGGYQFYKTPSYRDKKASAERAKLAKQPTLRSAKHYKHCLELSLMTPALAEAFINMVVLILCKQEIRRNKRQFDEFIRA